ncbi:MAG: peroxidase family protein [Pirellulales bacterium]
MSDRPPLGQLVGIWNLITRLHRITLTTALMLGIIQSVIGVVRAEDRSIDGSGNNVSNTHWGAVGTQLRRVAPDDYADGLSALAGASRPSAREVSNTVGAQTSPTVNGHGMTAMVWQWGQFLDHDIDLTVGSGESADISIPTGDPYFDPFNTGTQVLHFTRSNYDPATGTVDPRQQVNSITAYIDASNVYGSDAVRAAALRTGIGGKLKTDLNGLLPKNTSLLPNANDGMFNDEDMFLAGDIRANEQVGLTSMHTLFMWEHNRLADEIAIANPSWTDDQIYQRARKIVGAELQVITYDEFLPALLGPSAPGLLSTYDPSLSAGIANEFSTALYRLGHSMIGGDLLRVKPDGTVAPGGSLPLRDAFFNPTVLTSADEVEFILNGLTKEMAQELDVKVIDDLRNFLFGPPGSGGLDLLSLNLQRGRDHGLADYNSVRVAYGLDPVATFADITSDVDLQLDLQSLYGNVDDIDLWVGALAEDHLPDSSLGELLSTAIIDQFVRLRDGDRFWYRNDPEFSASDIAALEATSLSDVIMRNTAMEGMRHHIMTVPEPSALTFALLAIASGCVLRRRSD